MLSWYVLDYRLLNGLYTAFIQQNGPREGMEVGLVFVPFFLLRHCADMYAYAFSFCFFLFLFLYIYFPSLSFSGVKGLIEANHN